MNKLSASCIAAVLAAATFSVSAADMTSQEQSELRARAEQLQAEKQRNPSWDGARTADSRSDMRSSGARDVKSAKVKKTKVKKTKSKKNKNKLKRTSSKTHDQSQRAR